jgi:hypothetical protein
MVLGAYQRRAFYGSPLYGGPPGLALKSWARVGVTASGKDSSLLQKPSWVPYQRSDNYYLSYIFTESPHSPLPKKFITKLGSYSFVQWHTQPVMKKFLRYLQHLHQQKTFWQRNLQIFVSEK